MRKNTLLSERNKEWLIPLLAIALGLLVRLVYIGKYPMGLNQDEASAGYDAFAVLRYGIDRNGIHNPIHLIAWGSGQNMAYSWLCMPLIALFGLSELTVRLPMATVGCISVILFYFFLKNIRGEDKRFVWLGTFLFAIFPWHILKSRWGLESNLFPDLILWGAFLLTLFWKKGKGVYLCLGYFLFAFSAYAYGSAYCFLPFFVLPLTAYLFCRKKANLKQLLLALAVFGITVLPILLFVFINTFDNPQIDLGLFTIPRLYVNRHTEMASVFSGNLLQTSWHNFTTSVKILVRQEDGLPWNAMPYFGLTYPITLPLTLWGLGISIGKFRSRNAQGPEFIMDFWFLASVVLLFVVEPNINRINIMMIPWMYYTAAGTADLAGRIRFGGRTAAAVFAVFFVLFARVYFTDYQEEISHKFDVGFGDSITQAAAMDTERVYVTAKANQPYIYVLFYTQTSPERYRATVQYKARFTAFEEIASFDKYLFGTPEQPDPKENAAYVLSYSEISQFPEAEFVFIEPGGDYLVAVPRNTEANP